MALFLCDKSDKFIIIIDFKDDDNNKVKNYSEQCSSISHSLTLAHSNMECLRMVGLVGIENRRNIVSIYIVEVSIYAGPIIVSPAFVFPHCIG